MCLCDPLPENNYECKLNEFPGMTNIGCQSNDLNVCWPSNISDYSFEEDTELVLEATNFIVMDCWVAMFLFS